MKRKRRDVQPEGRRQVRPQPSDCSAQAVAHLSRPRVAVGRSVRSVHQQQLPYILPSRRTTVSSKYKQNTTSHARERSTLSRGVTEPLRCTRVESNAIPARDGVLADARPTPRLRLLPAQPSQVATVSDVDVGWDEN